MKILLEQTEWDFTGCSDNEWEYCYGYEFAREQEDIRKRVANYRECFPSLESFDDLRRTPYGGEELSLRSAHPDHPIKLGLFACCPEFPELPFLSIRPIERQKRIESFHPEFIRRNLSADRVVSNLSWPQAEIIPFSIDWTLTNAELVNSFRIWVETRRGSRVPSEKRGGGCDLRQIKSRLKCLGAKRLLREMVYAKAYLYSKKLNGKPLFEDNGSTWSRANSEANEIIKTICFPLPLANFGVVLKCNKD